MHLFFFSFPLYIRNQATSSKAINKLKIFKKKNPTKYRGSGPSLNLRLCPLELCFIKDP